MRAKTGIEDHRVTSVDDRCRVCGGLVCVQGRRLCYGGNDCCGAYPDEADLVLVYRLIASVCGYVG
jgi:hypothetical protein